MNFPTSQTPPPPFPGQPQTSVAPEPAGPGLSQGQRVINMFFAPGKTFEDLRRNASWWVPWLLTSVFTIAFFVMIDQKVGFDQVARDMMANNSRLQQAPPAQQEQAVKFTAMSLKIGGYASPAFILLYAVIIAAVLMGTFNFAMDAQVSFATSIAIVLYSWVAGIVGTILAIVSLAFGNPEGFKMQNPVGTNPAYFLDMASTSKFLYSFLTAFDVISLWMVALIGIGFAVNAKKKISTGAAISVVATWFFLYKLGSAALASFR